MSPPSPDAPTLSVIPPLNSGISSSTPWRFGKNVKIDNTTSGGFDTGALQIKTTSVVSSGALNIGVNASLVKARIDASGNFDTSGYITTSSSLDVGTAITGGSTLDVQGAISTLGSLNATSLNIRNAAGNNFLTVSDTGVLSTNGSITAVGGLTIATNFIVAASTGNLSTTGTIYSSGTISVGATSGSPNVKVQNDGQIIAKGDLLISSDLTEKFKVTSSTGALKSGAITSGTINAIGTLTASGDLSIGSIFKVTSVGGGITSGGITSGSISATGTLYASSDLTIGSIFKVTSTTGAITSGGITSGSISATGTLYASSDLTIGTIFKVTSTTGDITSGAITSTTIRATGDVKIGGTTSTPKVFIGSSTGIITTDLAVSSYTLPASSSDTTTTSVSTTDPSTSSATSTYLVTQKYVDQELWKQTKRINTILGTDASNITESFNRVFKLVTELEGSTVGTAVNDLISSNNGLIDQTTEVKTSVRDVAINSYNSIIINCAPAVWQDECAPMPIPKSVTSVDASYNNPYIGDGWYFKNMKQVTDTTTNKINWYLPSNGMKVSDIKNMFLNIYAVSDKSLPMISVWTKPKGTNDLMPYVCNARINYMFNSPTTTKSNNAKKSYSLYTGSAAPRNIYDLTAVQCYQTTTANSTNKDNGTYGSLISTANGVVAIDKTIVSDNDIVACFIVQSASINTVNDVEFVLQSFNVQQLSGTTQMLFNNASVFMNYFYNSLHEQNIDFSSIFSKNATPSGDAPAGQYTKQQEYLTVYDAANSPSPAV